MPDIRSRQVAWWEVHQYVTPVLDRIATWPLVGTPVWCALDDDDPVKVAASFDAAQHHALRIDCEQSARADASRDVADAADWPAVARRIANRSKVYIPRRRSDVA